MTNTPGIRNARPGDAETLETLSSAAFEKPSLRERFRAAVERDEVIVVDHDNEPLAFAWVQPHGFFGHAFINLLAVAPLHRRRGYATALMSAAARRATSNRIFTSTNASNAVMRALCEKNGWLRCGEIDALDAGDPEIVYVKWLGPR